MDGFAPEYVLPKIRGSKTVFGFVQKIQAKMGNFLTTPSSSSGGAELVGTQVAQSLWAKLQSEDSNGKVSTQFEKKGVGPVPFLA